MITPRTLNFVSGLRVRAEIGQIDNVWGNNNSETLGISFSTHEVILSVHSLRDCIGTRELGYRLDQTSPKLHRRATEVEGALVIDIEVKAAE